MKEIAQININLDEDSDRKGLRLHLLNAEDDLEKTFRAVLQLFNDHKPIGSYLHQLVTIHSVRGNKYEHGVTDVNNWLQTEYGDHPTFDPGTRNTTYVVTVDNSSAPPFGTIQNLNGQTGTWKDDHNKTQSPPYDRLQFTFTFVLINQNWLILNLVSKP